MLERCRLCLLFTESLCRVEPWHALEEALAGGVDLVQWREKSGDRQGLERTLAICSAAGVPVIVNDFVELAAGTSAAGAHVGQEDMPAATARGCLGKKLLGVSTHSAAQVLAAQAAGADYVGLGPCFATTTKGYSRGLPRDVLREALALARVPVFLIGGITPENLPELRSLGASRIAVASAILAAPSPRAAARRLAEHLLP